MVRKCQVLILEFVVLVLMNPAGWAWAGDWREEVRLLAKNGSVLVEDDGGRVILDLNSDQAFIPASTLKIVTGAAALDTLGPGFRFSTEFRITSQGDLLVVGRGDPYLISEEIDYIVQTMKAKGLTQVGDIYLDNRYFPPNLVLHGTTRTLNPYDAYNGALCVNFNTINVRVGPGRKVVSAEPQTPLTPLAKELALKRGVKGKVRINLAETPDTCLLYAGELIKAILEKNGVPVNGRILKSSMDPESVPLFYHHLSRKTLSQLIKDVFEFSNNFMANQIFLTMGAVVSGPPADVEKSRQAVSVFLKKLGLPPIHIEEGSGLSRKTKISTRQMTVVLKYFKSHHDLMTHQGRSWFKTGTLSDVKALAGYIETGDGRLYTFAILLNGETVAWGTRERILKVLEKNLE